MKSVALRFAVGMSVVIGVAQAADPVISNLTVQQRVGTKLVDIYYDVSDSDGDKVNVSVQVSTNAGLAYDFVVTALQGDLGRELDVGTNKHIVWDMSVDWDGKFSTNLVARVRADDGAGVQIPSDMVQIPAGSFQMGDTFGDGYANERPVHSVFVSAFHIDRYEVTLAKWSRVYVWATNHGYTFANGGQGKGTNYPVHTVSWYDCVKWCNARSEMEGLVPCYYTGATLSNVYRTGTVVLQTEWVKWSADGYRLPTEAEWEKAVRGGTPGHRFSWVDADTISHARATYYAGTGYSFDLSSGAGAHPTYNDGVCPLVAPVGSFAPNPFGLYDMTGNIYEWCWDWRDAAWYSNSGATLSDTRGPAAGNYRITRGGSAHNQVYDATCSGRNPSTPPASALCYQGFRCVR